MGTITYHPNKSLNFKEAITMTNMEAHIIACIIKDGSIELSCRANKTEQKTIRKLVAQGWLVGVDGNHNFFKFDLDRAYYNI
jgi:hypothetical protein